MSTNIKLGIKNAIKQVGINWTDEQLNEALNVFGNIEMNGYLIQGFVQYYNTGDFNGLTKGGIYLFHSTNESIDNTPVSDGILEVLPSQNTAGTEQMVIQRVTAISQNEATGAIYLRSGRYANNTWTWISNPKWIAISTSGGTQTLDTVVTEDSQNPVTSAGIYDFVENQIVQATDPYIELYLSRTNNIIDNTLLMRFVNFQEAVPTTYTALVSSNDFKKALLNNVLVYMGAYGDDNTALACQGSLMSGNAYFPLPTDQFWFVCLTTTIIWQSHYTAFLTGYPTYDDGAWYLTNVNLQEPFWVDAVQDAISDSMNYTDTKTTYTNPNGTTVAVGGIKVGTTFDNKSITDIIQDMLYPYVPFTFSNFATTESGGTFEYGTTRTVTKVMPTYSGGTLTVSGLKVGTSSGGTQLYNGAPGNSGTAVTLTTSWTWNGTATSTIYGQLTDTSSSPVKSVTFTPLKKFYWADTSTSGAAPTQASTGLHYGTYNTAASGSSAIVVDANSYLYFMIPTYTAASTIQQYANGQWRNVGTTYLGTATFQLATGATLTYYNLQLTDKIATATSGLQFRVYAG